MFYILTQKIVLSIQNVLYYCFVKKYHLAMVFPYILVAASRNVYPNELCSSGPFASYGSNGINICSRQLPAPNLSVRSRHFHTRIKKHPLWGVCLFLVALIGIEPILIAELDFESSASTSSATEPTYRNCVRFILQFSRKLF